MAELFSKKKTSQNYNKVEIYATADNMIKVVPKLARQISKQDFAKETGII